MPEQNVTQRITASPFVSSKSVHAATIATGTTKGQFGDRLIIPTHFGRVVGFHISSDQNITAVLRTYSASRIIFTDPVSQAVTGGTPLGYQVNQIGTVFIGDECELLITNSSGSTATITATIISRS